MIIFKIELDKKSLKLIPKKERELLIFSSHGLNEINTLSKLFRLALQRPTTEPERQLMVMQSLFLARLLAGKLYELWSIFNKIFYGSKVSAQYFELFDDNVKTTLRDVKKYFSKSNTLSAIRNQYAFHYDEKSAEIGLESFPEHLPLHLYFDGTVENTVYAFADQLISYAALQSIDPDDNRNAINKFMDDTSVATKNFQTILTHCMQHVIDRHMPNVFSKDRVTKSSVTAKNWNDSYLPFFVEDAKAFFFPTSDGKNLSWGQGNEQSPSFLLKLI